MNTENLLPSLNLMTLVVVLVLAVAAFAYFLRSRRNRAIASHAFSDSETSPNDVTRGPTR